MSTPPNGPDPDDPTGAHQPAATPPPPVAPGPPPTIPRSGVGSGGHFDDILNMLGDTASDSSKPTVPEPAPQPQPVAPPAEPTVTVNVNDLVAMMQQIRDEGGNPDAAQPTQRDVVGDSWRLQQQLRRLGEESQYPNGAPIVENAAPVLKRELDAAGEPKVPATKVNPVRGAVNTPTRVSPTGPGREATKKLADDSHAALFLDKDGHRRPLRETLFATTTHPEALNAALARNLGEYTQTTADYIRENLQVASENGTDYVFLPAAPTSDEPGVIPGAPLPVRVQGKNNAKSAAKSQRTQLEATMAQGPDHPKTLAEKLLDVDHGLAVATALASHPGTTPTDAQAPNAVRRRWRERTGATIDEVHRRGQAVVDATIANALMTPLRLTHEQQIAQEPDVKKESDRYDGRIAAILARSLPLTESGKSHVAVAAEAVATSAMLAFFNAIPQDQLPQPLVRTHNLDGTVSYYPTPLSRDPQEVIDELTASRDLLLAQLSEPDLSHVKIETPKALDRAADRTANAASRKAAGEASRQKRNADDGLLKRTGKGAARLAGKAIAYTIAAPLKGAKHLTYDMAFYHGVSPAKINKKLDKSDVNGPTYIGVTPGELLDLQQRFTSNIVSLVTPGPHRRASQDMVAKIARSVGAM